MRFNSGIPQGRRRVWSIFRGSYSQPLPRKHCPGILTEAMGIGGGQEGRGSRGCLWTHHFTDRITEHRRRGRRFSEKDLPSFFPTPVSLVLNPVLTGYKAQYKCLSSGAHEFPPRNPQTWGGGVCVAVIDPTLQMGKLRSREIKNFNCWTHSGSDSRRVL